METHEYGIFYLTISRNEFVEDEGWTDHHYDEYYYKNITVPSGYINAEDGLKEVMEGVVELIEDEVESVYSNKFNSPDIVINPGSLFTQGEDDDVLYLLGTIHNRDDYDKCAILDITFKLKEVKKSPINKEKIEQAGIECDM